LYTLSLHDALPISMHLSVLDTAEAEREGLTLKGKFNRLDAWLAVQAVHELTDTPVRQLVNHINRFPGLQRRMEEIVPGLYSDYAHTPEKVRGCLSVALEMAAAKGQDVIVVFEPLHNRRQHYMIGEYSDCFSGAQKLYWLPCYLPREDSSQRIIPPAEMIAHLSDPSIGQPMERDATLKKTIQKH